MKKSSKSEEKTKCDLCSKENTLLYPVKKEEDGEEYKLCKDCLKIVHDSYVKLK